MKSNYPVTINTVQLAKDLNTETQKRKLSDRKAAKKIGISPATYMRLNTAERTPTIEVMALALIYLNKDFKDYVTVTV